MASSKQDYVAAAALFRGAVTRGRNLSRSTSQFDREASGPVLSEVRRLARDFADYYGKTNERFDCEKFLGACGCDEAAKIADYLNGGAHA